MTKKLMLNAKQIELRLANTGMTIRVEDDDDEYCGRLQISKVGLRWTPKYAWKDGPRTVLLTWDDLPELFRTL